LSPDRPYPDFAIVSLKEHLELRVSALEQKVSLQVEGAKVALDLAKGIADEQRVASNKVRDQLREQAATFVNRESYEMANASMAHRIELLEAAAANVQGRMWALGISLGIFVTILQLFVRHVIGPK